jgi:23S rRNA (guanine2445-N2)-methyltransferase / 23S rRNA (guanine2069-N7)-methyltransferase
MIELIAACGFGLESLVRRELMALGLDSQIVGPGHVAFQGEASSIAATNIWLRTADRVLVSMGELACDDFDMLFDAVEQLPWENWVGPSDAFLVTAHSVQSQLTSVPACQRTVKKAIANRLINAHGVTTLPETGVAYSIHLGLVRNRARLTIDTSGPSLHRRGYRTRYPRGALKETLAAASVQLSYWDRDRPLLDPFCGSGTIAIEAAMVGRNLAPGRHRAFAAESWPAIPVAIWDQVRSEADEQALPDLDNRIVGLDIDQRVLGFARQSAIAAGVKNSIHFQPSSFTRATSKRRYGCVITNPPWVASGQPRYELDSIIRTIPEVLRHLPTWSHFILSDHPEFEKLVGRSADRRRKLYNDRTQCFLFQFAGPKPPVDRRTASDDGAEDTQASETSDGEATAAPQRRSAGTVVQGAAFGELTDKSRHQADLFSRRLANRARHLRRWPTRQDITCFRLYERDVPEIPLVVDRYEDHLHITEYERPHDRDPALHAAWLDLMARTAGKTLEIPPQQVFFKRRGRQRGDDQHQQVADQHYEIQVREGGLRFWVNLSDYVDTGLFLDHRVTRSMVRDECKGKRFLNLFAYTGSFSVYAADGAAASTVTVDWSNQYLQWAKRNMESNGFQGDDHQFVRSDAVDFVNNLPKTPLFDVAVVDPPTFSNSKRSEQDWDVQVGYADLINSLLVRMEPGGVIYFSTNFRRFKFDAASIAASHQHEISKQTVPADFRNRRIHRCWKIVK